MFLFYMETSHFSYLSFCKTVHGTDENLLSSKPYERNIFSTMVALEFLRSLYGSPIVVNSGFRSSSVNLAVNGARNSAHLIGLAADIRPVFNDDFKCNIRFLYDCCKKLRSLGVFSYVEYHPTYIHVNLPR